MRVNQRFVRWLVPVALCLGGCAGPSAKVVHELPAAVSLPAGGAFVAGRFDATGPGEQWIGDFLGEEVVRRMEGLSGSPGLDEPLTISGRAEVEVVDDAGVRPARRHDPQTGRLEQVELPYLIRTVDVRVVFAIASASDEPPVELETHQRYVSSRDPRIRGEYGLHRGDDPGRVPPTDKVTRELLIECVETARGMVEPVQLPVTLKFRYAADAASRAGLSAVEDGDFTAATEHFRRAVETDRTRPATLFNLAAAYEAAGLVDQARRHYQAALGASQGEDDEAAESQARTEAILSRDGPLRIRR